MNTSKVLWATDGNPMSTIIRGLKVMGTANMNELWAEFKTTFNEDSWFQTENQKQVLTSAKRVLSNQKDAHAQFQGLLKILYQSQHKQVADEDQVHQLILNVLTTWLTQEKPNRVKVQGVISDLLNSGLVKGKKNDPQLIQLINDLIIIGAQVAYYRDDEEKFITVIPDPEEEVHDPEKELLQSRKTQLRFFLNNVSEIISKTQGTPRGTGRVLVPDPEEISSILERTLEEIEYETLDHAPTQALFQEFFSSAAYDAQEFEGYQTFIKNWLANNKANRDEADEVILLHLLQRGVEQISKERESAGLGQGYRPFSTSAQNFIKFLTQIHKEYGAPHSVKLQEFKEEIAIRQAKLLDSASDQQAVFSLAEKLFAIANSCDVPRERRAAFYHRLWEVSVEKSSFVQDGLSIHGDFPKYDLWRIPGFWLEGSIYYHPNHSGFGVLEVPTPVADKKGIPKFFWNGFLRTFIQSYREKELKTLMAEKNYPAIWTFFENLNGLNLMWVIKPRERLSSAEKQLYFLEHAEQNQAFLQEVKEEVKKTVKDCQASFNSINDFIQYLKTAIANKSTLLSNECDWDFVNKNPYGDDNFTWNSARSERLLLVTLNEQQLGRWLKTPSDYKKILKTLVVDLLAVEKPLYTDFVVKQINVLMGINAEMTESALYELKAEYSEQLQQQWGMIEARIFTPKRSVLLSTLLNLTCLNDMERRYADDHPHSANPLDRERWYHQFLTKLFTALGDSTPWLGELKTGSASGQTFQDTFTEALIQLLQLSYDSLATSNADQYSLEKKWVSSLSLVFMLLEKPSSEHYKKLIFAFYELKQKYEFTYAPYKGDWPRSNSYDYDLVMDLLVTRAQTLQTVEELKAFTDLLKELEQQYSFPKGGIEQELEKAVTREIALLENPALQSSRREKRIADFRVQFLFNHFSSTPSCQGLLKTLSILRNTYQLPIDNVDKALLKQLVYAAIKRDINETEWKKPDLKSVFSLCSFFKEDQDLIQLIFSVLEQTGIVQQLEDLPKGVFEQQFIRYVIDHQAKRMLAKKSETLPGEFKWIIIDRYKLLQRRGMAELMPFDFLQAYFAYCTRSDSIDHERFSRLCSFAQFVLYEIPYEDKAIPDLLKQLTEKLTLTGYEQLIETLLEYAKHHHQPTGKLEDFLFATLEIVASKSETEVDRAHLREFLKKLNEQFLFSSPDKQLEFIHLVKKIVAHQLQENLLAMGHMVQEIESLIVPQSIYDSVERFEGYKDEEQKNNKIYLDHKKKLTEYPKSLDKAKIKCHQKIQLIKDGDQANKSLDTAKIYALIKKSEKAKVTVSETLQEIKTIHQTLVKEVNVEVSQIEDALKTRYAASIGKF